MFGFLASRFQSPRAGEQARPGWFDRHFTPVLLSIAKKACTHPVHTIVAIAFLASYSYLGVLDKGFLEQNDATPGQVDFNTLLAGSKILRVGEETSWKWVVEENKAANVEQVCQTAWPARGSADKKPKTQELGLVTFVFPDSSATNSAPSQIAIPANISAKPLPSSSNSFSTISHDTSLAYAVPYAEAADFLMAMQEISAPKDASESHGSKAEGTHEEKKWIMKAAKSGNASGGIRTWFQDSWTSFVDLLKVRTFGFWNIQGVLLTLYRMPTLATLSSWPWATWPCT